MTQDPAAAPLTRDVILGSWRMASWVTRDIETGERRDALGPNPDGIVVYSPERVSFLIVTSDRKRPAMLPPTEPEKLVLFDTMFAYSGRYTVFPDRIVHHVDLSWNEGWTGTDQVRLARLDGDTLTISSLPAPSPFDGRQIIHEVVFKREGPA
jgi:hypothetical protein